MIERYFPDPTHRSLVYVSFAFLAILGIYALIAALLRRYGKNPKYLIPRNTIRKVAVPLLLILFSLLLFQELFLYNLLCYRCGNRNSRNGGIR